MIRRLMLAVVPIVAGWASGVHGAVAVADRDRLWPDHRVPFVICETVEAADTSPRPASSGCGHGGAPLAAAEAEKVREAVAQWNNHFDNELHFVEVARLDRTDRGVLFSRSKQENSCSTDTIGRPVRAKRTNVKLGSRCNSFAATQTPVGTILHEMMHVAGFYHEQQRPDRDEFLTSRVPHGIVSVMFDIHGATQWAKGSRMRWRMLSPYDFGSIMHYPVKDPRKAELTSEGIERLSVQGLSMNDPGRRDAMSADDVAAIKWLYRSLPDPRIAAGQPMAKGEKSRL